MKLLVIQILISSVLNYKSLCFQKIVVSIMHDLLVIKDYDFIKIIFLSFKLAS